MIDFTGEITQPPWQHSFLCLPTREVSLSLHDALSYRYCVLVLVTETHKETVKADKL